MMHIITVKGMKYGEKVVFLFQEKSDAERYALMLEVQGDPEMDVIEVKDNVAIGACERTGTRYTVISSDDIVVPPPPDNK